MSNTTVQRLIVKGTTDQLPEAARGPGGSKTSELWAAVAEQCRTQPGTWFIFEIPGRSSKSLQSTRSHIKQGKTFAFKEGKWDAAVRGTVLYVKYLGEASAEVVDFKKAEVA